MLLRIFWEGIYSPSFIFALYTSNRLDLFDHSLTIERIDMPSMDPKWAYNKDFLFDIDNYDYWKECMSVHIQSVDGVMSNKPKVEWIADDTMIVEYNLKARNILIPALDINEYHLVSHC